MLSIIILFLSVVLASGFCSMSEAALLSLPFIRARILSEQHKKHSKTLLFVKTNITDAVAVIAIVNNIINIVGSIYIGQLVSRLFGKEWLGLTSTLLVFMIIIFSEIIPKTVGERYKVSLSLVLARPIKILILLFRPLVRMLMWISKPFLGEVNRLKVTEEEIKMMLKLGRVEGTVEIDEEVLCNRIFKLNDVNIMQIMKPIENIYALPAGCTLEDLKDKVMESPYSRIAVYDKDKTDIVGVIQHRVLLREIAKDNYKAYVREFMTEPIFVNWFMKIDDLLEKFQLHKQHLFIVQDGEGKDVGIVTMEDALEELFGEIYDERDMDRQKQLKSAEDKHI